MISLGGLPCFEGKRRRGGSGEEGRLRGELRREEGGETAVQDVIHERRIHKSKRKDL